MIENRFAARLARGLARVRRGAFAAAPLAIALTAASPDAQATPQFARQTGKTCAFCHAGPPRLNDAGLAFKANDFRLPDAGKAPDKDTRTSPAQ
jgi:hypothetical protein